MRKTIFFLLIIFQAWQLPAQNFSFIYDDLERTYIVSLPSGYDPGTVYPLIINMHGLGSNALEQQFYSQFNFVADTAGIIMVYPNGVNNLWNITFGSGVDDVGFISALIDTMAANFPVDLNRVYATGMSMGGFMSYRLACQLESRIAAVASVTGLLLFSPCQPSVPVPVLQIHGTEDPTVPYSGVANTIDHWIAHNNCPEDPEIIDLPDIDTTDQSTVTLSIYSPCDEGTEVLLYTVNGGEHTWPGTSIIIGVTNQDIHASAEIWNFFKKYSLEGPAGTGDQSYVNPGIRISPNPVKSAAFIEIPCGESNSWTLRLFDLSGKLVRQEDIGRTADYRFNINGLINGLYIIELFSDEVVFRDKIVITRF